MERIASHHNPRLDILRPKISSDHYIEHNLRSKLVGSFDETAAWTS